jgi:hypothetical protein
MKVLLVGQHAGVFRDLDSVVRELCRRGHQVVLLHGTPLDHLQVRDITGVTTRERPEPSEAWPRRLRVGRQVINRGIYLRKGHPSPERVVASIENHLPDDVRAKVQTPLWRSAIGTRAALRVWRWIEAASPASPTVVSLLKQIDPDVMLVSPTIWPKDPVEADYLHAGRTLGIPTIGDPTCWDDLTSNGTVHVLPDVYLAWNEAIAQEAVEIHDIPASSIRITGAPHLDTFFSLRPRMTRAEVCARLGHPDAPYIVFLGSPRTLWDDESFMVKAIADALARAFGAGAPALVVRPHPTNLAPFNAFAHHGVVIDRNVGDPADSPVLAHEYFDLLAHATCVFGVNTPAFLEAVVADRPCLTIVSETYWPAQGRTGHFRHLLKGAFLDVCRDMGDVAACVRRIVDGADDRASDRRAFTRWFIRPCGLDIAASDVVASVIETAARPNAGRAPMSAVARQHHVPGLSLASEGIGR